MSYCDISAVQALNPSRRYGPQTTPNVDQVLSIIELKSGELDLMLASVGYAVPALLATSPITFKWLQQACAYGSAMDTEAGMYTGSSDVADTPHLAFLRKQWERMCDMILSKKVTFHDLPVVASGTTGSPLGQVRSLSTGGVGTSNFRISQADVRAW